MDMDTLMKEMVEYLKMAQAEAERSLRECKKALAQCAIARTHLDKLLENHNEVKEERNDHRRSHESATVND